MPGRVATEPPPAHFPPCLFPVSVSTASDPHLPKRASHTSALYGRWDDIESRFRDQGITFPSILKASWALTLQCYVSSEVLCFEYRGKGDSNEVSTNSDEPATTRDGSMLCIFRLDLGSTETLLDLMKRLEKGCVSGSLSLPEGRDILYLSPVPFENHCNTSLTFQDQTCEDQYPASSMVSLSYVGHWGDETDLQRGNWIFPSPSPRVAMVA